MNGHSSQWADESVDLYKYMLVCLTYLYICRKSVFSKTFNIDFLLAHPRFGGILQLRFVLYICTTLYNTSIMTAAPGIMLFAAQRESQSGIHNV